MVQLRSSPPAASAHAVLRRFLMDILMWLVVGLVAGALASFIFRSAGTILVDTVIGIAGAVVGGFIFRVTGLHTPFGGLAGEIVVAFFGAVVVVGGVHLVRRMRPKKD
jgi:uncharacterized membrane protein YeaQ/YmgE (transglycosylase-associated protein family)